MAQCEFSTFIDKNKTCAYSAQGDTGLCIWHNPDAKKDHPQIREELQKAIESTGGDLEGFLLRGADLSGMDFSNANMKDADLREARVDNANFSGADLRGAKLNRVSGVAANFENANLMAASLSFGNFTNANFRGVNFRIVHVEYANFVGADFEGSDKRHTQFINVKMSEDSPTTDAAPAGQEALFDENEIQGEEAASPAAPQQAQPQVQPQIEPQPGQQQPAASQQVQQQPQQAGPVQPQQGSASGPKNIVLFGRPVSLWSFAGTAAACVLAIFLIAVLISDDDNEQTGTTDTSQANRGVKQPDTRDQPSGDPQKNTEETDTSAKEPKENKVALDTKEQQLQTLRNALEKQKQLSENVKESEKKIDDLLTQIDKEKKEFENRIRTLTTNLNDAEKNQEKLRTDLAKARTELDNAKKALEKKETFIAGQMKEFEEKLSQTENAMKSKKGTFENFAHIISQLRETNDGLVKEYEKKINDYEAKIARLAKWYEQDKAFTKSNFDHFLIGWDRYTVVGSPSGSYVVGVKFRRESKTNAATDVFVLGIRGASKPIFQVTVYDVDGKKIKTDIKAMSTNPVEKGDVITASRKWKAGRMPRYFSIDFVQ